MTRQTTALRCTAWGLALLVVLGALVLAEGGEWHDGSLEVVSRGGAGRGHGPLVGMGLAG